jgi:SAM-dependent methyltransferase
MHVEARRYVWEQLQELPHRTTVLELGSRNVNGSVRDLFTGSWYLGIDVRPGPGVDVVADATTYTPPSPPDTVLCLEVLEHTADAPAILANAHRILAPGGVLLATMATHPRAPHSAFDGGGLKPGEYYRNVDLSELSDWLQAAGFAAPDAVRWEMDTEHGDLYVCATKGAG